MTDLSNSSSQLSTVSLLILSIVSVFALISCSGSNDLSRNRAESLIQEKFESMPPATHPLKTGKYSYWDTNNIWKEIQIGKGMLHGKKVVSFKLIQIESDPFAKREETIKHFNNEAKRRKTSFMPLEEKFGREIRSDLIETRLIGNKAFKTRYGGYGHTSRDHTKRVNYYVNEITHAIKLTKKGSIYSISTKSGEVSVKTADWKYIEITGITKPAANKGQTECVVDFSYKMMPTPFGEIYISSDKLTVLSGLKNKIQKKV